MPVASLARSNNASSMFSVVRMHIIMRQSGIRSGNGEWSNLPDQWRHLPFPFSASNQVICDKGPYRR